jgi:hypothetical protein
MFPLCRIRTNTLHRWALGIGAVMLFANATGCLHRRLTIRSNPSGAVVFVDEQPIGVTPVSTSFTYYGTRKVQLFKDGFETLTVKHPIRPPWYQIPPLDFFSENLWPAEIRDERAAEFDLQPQRVVPNQELVERAETLRSNARQGMTTPLFGVR